LSRPADLNALAVFAAVAQEEGFTAAARRLRMSKSAVSKSVSALEGRLGVRLFNRTTRRLSLTEAGARLLDGARNALAMAEAAEQAVGNLAAAPRGTLRVNAPVSFGARHIADVLPEFLARYPDLAVDLDLLDRRVDPVEEGYDVTIRIGRLADSTLIARTLAPTRFVVGAAPAYLAAHGTPRTPAALREHACLSYSYQRTGREWVFAAADGRTLRVPVTGQLRANSGDLLLKVACAGEGIVLAPTFLCAEEVVAGRLVPLLTEWTPMPGGAIHALFHESRNLLPKVRVFIDFLVEHFGAVPEWDRRIAAARHDFQP